MKRGALNVDFVGGGSQFIAAVLLLAGMVSVSTVAYYGYRLDQQARDLEDVAAAQGAARSAEARTRLDQAAVPPEVLQAARDAAAELGIAWPVLFSKLETVADDGIALLAVQPDAKSGSVVLQGEGRDLRAVVRFVQRLQDEAGFVRPLLVNHALRTNEPGRPIAFTVQAGWGKWR